MKVVQEMDISVKITQKRGIMFNQFIILISQFK